MQYNKLDIDSLWYEYKKNGSDELRQTLILNYVSLINYTISKMVLPVNTILEESDFVNIGVLGLYEAIERFEPDRQIKFETYAIKRIKGKIQDELRKLDWLSRTARKRATEFKSISDTMQQRQEKGDTEQQVLNELKISPEQYRSYLIAASDAKSSIPISDSSLKIINDDDEEVNFLEEIADESQDFLSEILEEEKQKYLASSISKLKENKRNVLVLYYFENLNFKEIGQVLGVSESRISQIHTETIKELKLKMNRYEDA
ncbi:MAG: FliA/WhiG family RNA polymerase sigma factor [Candidatus Kapabacteria bacterium]|nr:FliA/WhiG family RNA polymerase sigma factor [Ignavibacteriota bacterium]MCW5883500.1 FliA/WhiG family RNA polymerase sigma factor [Candidatus Kapabacteria bacterium]